MALIDGGGWQPIERPPELKTQEAQTYSKRAIQQASKIKNKIKKYYPYVLLFACVNTLYYIFMCHAATPTYVRTDKGLIDAVTGFDPAQHPLIIIIQLLLNISLFSLNQITKRK